MKLQTELIELSKKVKDFCKIKSVSNIVPTIELSADTEIPMPYIFKCEALHPGTYKGYTIEREEIVNGMSTIMNSDGNFHNYEINIDHKSSRKDDSSIKDLVGKIISYEYDYSKDAYILTGAVYDRDEAIKIANGLTKYVSLRINPGVVEHTGNKRYARQLVFEELSFVRAPGDPKAKIITN